MLNPETNKTQTTFVCVLLRFIATSSVDGLFIAQSHRHVLLYNRRANTFSSAALNMLSTMVESDAGRTAGTDSNQATVTSNTTWPRAHLSQRSLSDLQYRIQLERAIKTARQNMERATAENAKGAEEEVQKTYRRITQKLLRLVEKVRDTKNAQMLAKAGKKRRRERAGSVAHKNEPHFGSMILYGTLQRDQGMEMRRGVALARERRGLSLRRKSISILSDDVSTVPDEEEREGLAAVGEAAEEEPLLLRHLPLLSTLLFAALTIGVGALLFQAVDSSIAEKPFHRVVIFCFQALGTIGWGDVRAGTEWGQVLCTVYTLFGVPVFFSALANLGRLCLSEFYTIDWIFLTCVVRPQKEGEPVVQQHMPLRKSMFWLCIHQFVGLILYGELFKHYRPVSTIYFCITSMATIGIGDFHPDSSNLGESVVAVVFIGSGIGLLAAFFIGVAYHFQTLFFVHLRGLLLQTISAKN